MNERKKIERQRTELAGKDVTTQLLWQLLVSKQQEEIEHHELLIRLLSLRLKELTEGNEPEQPAKGVTKNDVKRIYRSGNNGRPCF